MIGRSVTVAGVAGPLYTVHKVVLAGGTWFGGSTGTVLLYTKCHCGRSTGSRLLYTKACEEVVKLLSDYITCSMALIS